MPIESKAEAEGEGEEEEEEEEVEDIGCKVSISAGAAQVDGQPAKRYGHIYWGAQ